MSKGFVLRDSIERCKKYTESLILAQNERWRRGLDMQVERKEN